jgi:hypothetical protein
LNTLKLFSPLLKRRFIPTLYSDKAVVFSGRLSVEAGNLAAFAGKRQREVMLMKRVCVFVTLALLCAGAAFGQTDRKNALGIDVAPTLRSLAVMNSPKTWFSGAGVFYERLLAPHFSLGGRFDFLIGSYDNVIKADINYFALSAHGRVYPLSQGLAKLYLDAGIGFNAINVDYPGVENKQGVTFALKAGYKHFFNDMIFVEPSMAFVYAETISKTWPYVAQANDPSPIEWTPGLLIGFSF